MLNLRMANSREREVAKQLTNALRDIYRKLGDDGWQNLHTVWRDYRRLSDFSLQELFNAARFSTRFGTRRFDCFWENASSGPPKVFVKLETHLLTNRDGE